MRKFASCLIITAVSLSGSVTGYAQKDASTASKTMEIPVLPKTPATLAADAILREYSGDIMVRHTKRAYLFALAFAKADEVTINRELVYVGTALHDLGLEEQFDGPGNFEDNGAAAAARFLTKAGFRALAVDVEAAIKIHGDFATANHPRAEYALIHRGSLADVTGSGLEKIEPSYIAAVVEAYPRSGTKDLITAMLERQAKTKPDSNIGKTYARFPVSDLIRQAPFSD